MEDDGKVNFIIGDDLIEGLGRWHDAEYLKSHVRFYCFVRDNAMHNEPEGFEVVYIESEMTVSSSTQVREGDYSLVTDSVREYIEENGLYKAKG